jgi:UDP-N-acetylmuramoylalanine-D-glutamate ligase
VRTAVLWRSGSQVFTQIVSWCSTLIVIRLLAPQDYGLFAMASVMLVLLSTMNGWSLASALRTFRALAHRLEPVSERGGLTWLNDSKRWQKRARPP